MCTFSNFFHTDLIFCIVCSTIFPYSLCSTEESFVVVVVVVAAVVVIVVEVAEVVVKIICKLSAALFNHCICNVRVDSSPTGKICRDCQWCVGSRRS